MADFYGQKMQMSVNHHNAELKNCKFVIKYQLKN